MAEKKEESGAKGIVDLMRVSTQVKTGVDIGRFEQDVRETTAERVMESLRLRRGVRLSCAEEWLVFHGDEDGPGVALGAPASGYRLGSITLLLEPNLVHAKLLLEDSGTPRELAEAIMAHVEDEVLVFADEYEDVLWDVAYSTRVDSYSRPPRIEDEEG